MESNRKIDVVFLVKVLLRERSRREDFPAASKLLKITAPTR